MHLILSAMRRPATVMVIILSVALGSFLAVGPALFQHYRLPYPAGLPKGMEVDIFPKLNLPVIYVCQPYGGMDAAQMEGYLTNFYEYHFLYISGIHHVESRNVQGTALMKLYFHPETNMAQAMAETINYVNRSQAFMPPGTVSPFVMRFDTGSVPVGYLVLSSDTRSIAEIQDLALFRVRPMFSSLPGVSAPPPFGGSARSIVVTVDPKRLQSYGMSPEEAINAIVRGNAISPSGNIPIGDKYPIVPVNSVVKDPQQLGTIPIRMGEHPVYLRDIGTIQDSADAPAGYALVNGRRAVYILATKRAEASTLSVINNIKSSIPKMKAALGADGEGIDVRFEFDQSPYVTRAVGGVVTEGLLGAVLVGLMILLFLGDWRSSLIVVLNIPLALLSSLLALWITGQTINLMTLGGLALAIGILVDEATVAIENIHAHLQRGKPLAQAVRDGSMETVVPRLLAMLCILAVFVSSFFMQGAARALFVPLSLAVGFSMIASYILSSTFVPVMAVWLLKVQQEHGTEKQTFFDRLRRGYETLLGGFVNLRWLVIVAYLAICIAKNREFTETLRVELAKIPALRDLQLGQSMDYPTVQVNVDREKAGLSGLMPVDVSRALVTATSSSRFVVPNYWADPKSGVAYQVQVEIPRAVVRSPYDVETIDSIEQLGKIPLKRTNEGEVLIRDVASLQPGTMPGQYDRYNMKRQLTLTANVAAMDLGSVAGLVNQAIARAGDPPAGSVVEVRGQIPPMQEMQAGLTVGLALAIVAVFLLLTANFQSLRLALVTVSTAPAVIAGIVLMLWLTGTTLNIQSFIGSIMAVGVAMANAILLVTFAEKRRLELHNARDAAVQGAGSRLRAILMTSFAMIAGMLPMALAWGEAGQQNAPLGRAVVGGLIAATLATLFVLPSMFAFIQSRAGSSSASMDPTDPDSQYFVPQ